MRNIAAMAKDSQDLRPSSGIMKADPWIQVNGGNNQSRVGEKTHPLLIEDAGINKGNLPQPTN